MNQLPKTGSAALLEALSPYLDDGFINEQFSRRRIQGRHPNFCPAQLFRVLLLAVLSPVHSFNLLVDLLPENRQWREFALLPNKRVLPDAKMLSHFRERLGPLQLRRINQHLLEPLVRSLDWARKAVGIIDATDLPAATSCFKKKR